MNLKRNIYNMCNLLIATTCCYASEIKRVFVGVGMGNVLLERQNAKGYNRTKVASGLFDASNRFYSGGYQTHDGFSLAVHAHMVTLSSKKLLYGIDLFRGFASTEIFRPFLPYAMNKNLYPPDDAADLEKQAVLDATKMDMTDAIIFLGYPLHIHAHKKDDLFSYGKEGIYLAPLCMAGFSSIDMYSPKKGRAPIRHEVADNNIAKEQVAGLKKLSGIFGLGIGILIPRGNFLIESTHFIYWNIGSRYDFAKLGYKTAPTTSGGASAEKGSLIGTAAYVNKFLVLASHMHMTSVSWSASNGCSIGLIGRIDWISCKGDRYGTATANEEIVTSGAYANTPNICSWHVGVLFGYKTEL